MSASAGTTPHRFVQIDEEGFFKMDDVRVSDVEIGRQWLSKLKNDRFRFSTEMSRESVLVEAFDEPFIALEVNKTSDGKWSATMPYQHVESFQLESLTLDEWDRFHGRTDRGIPFVFSRSTQARFFDMVDEFDDDSITVDGKTYETKPWLPDSTDVTQASWWSEFYKTGQTRWDLGGPSPALPHYVPRLKLQRSRILVLGAGKGNDAAWFAEQGHIVTAVDFSADAIAAAKERYGHLNNLSFLQSDVFALPASHQQAFDVVFDHTCYCAITPSRRNELVKVWRRSLVDGGHLMAVFFTMDKPFGPPYGGSEWEIRARIQKNFRPLYWTRMRDSIDERMGQELFVYAQKLSGL